nr:MAG TPA: hypothetical protein [Microviridae sp.]
MIVDIKLHVNQLISYQRKKGVGLSAYPLPSAPPSKGAAGAHARARVTRTHARAN